MLDHFLCFVFIYYCRFFFITSYSLPNSFRKIMYFEAIKTSIVHVYKISTWHSQIITHNFSPCFYLFCLFKWHQTSIRWFCLSITTCDTILNPFTFPCPKLRYHVHYQNWCCHEWAMSDTQMDILMSSHNVSIYWITPNS